ncbi:sialidase family protein [Rhodococcus sp. NPDC003348]
MRRTARVLTLVFLLLLTVGTLPTGAVAAPPGPAEPEPAVLGVGQYPRLVRLDSGAIVASLTTRDAQGDFTQIMESTDEGVSFHPIGAVRDPEAIGGQCCATIFEMPQQVGFLPAGTLLWAGTVGYLAGTDRKVGIKVWSSADGGRNWSPLGVAARSSGDGGVWEPEFTVDAGLLWLYYADETERPRHSQVLSRVATLDGVNWWGRHVVQANDEQSLRPGMATIARLPDGRLASTHEMCEQGGDRCTPYLKFSDTGIWWGNGTFDPGVQVVADDGSMLKHSPFLTALAGGPNGTRLVLGGQALIDRDGKRDGRSGRVLLVNDNFGIGPWFEIAAPVPVQDPKADTCANYSSPLLPVDGGANLLQIAVTLKDGVCTARFGKGPAGPN